jgi:hypothetical protein
MIHQRFKSKELFSTVLLSLTILDQVDVAQFWPLLTIVLLLLIRKYFIMWLTLNTLNRAPIKNFFGGWDFFEKGYFLI